MTMMMMMDAHFSQKEETARKIKTGRKRERKKRARLLIFFAERDRESFCRAIHRLSKKRFEQNDYLILSRLTVCPCVGFAVEIL
mmetsp:Transcript_791/g.2849  ORF Transcript_791/g.2849 Transcript_791/m.2849 type:complete len:84 (+) Transcript_791:2582-2833(+)